MTFVALSLEVAGGWGDETVVDTSIHPPIVSRLEYRFDGWPDDDLLESFPVYIVTQALGEMLLDQHLSGFSLGDVQISTSYEFDSRHPGKQLPDYYWFKITGIAGKDDFGISASNLLVVSERSFSILKGHIVHATVEKFFPS